MFIGDKKEQNYNYFYRETNNNTKNKNVKPSFSTKKPRKINSRVDPDIGYKLCEKLYKYDNNINKNKKS